MDLLRRLELKTAKPQNLNTVRRILKIFQVLRLLLEAKIATKSGLGALGSTFEPSWGSWRLPEGSWRHLEALLEARGTLLERKKEGEGSRGELEGTRRELRERSSSGPGRGRGGVYTPSTLAKGLERPKV